jgi:hypothetical protein
MTRRVQFVLQLAIPALLLTFAVNPADAQKLIGPALIPLPAR